MERLKGAIRKLRNQIKAQDEIRLAKKHHLLRTFQQPGVLSDICSHELTPLEKKLKSIKFWKTCSKEPKQDPKEEEEYWRNVVAYREEQQRRAKGLSYEDSEMEDWDEEE